MLYSGFASSLSSFPSQFSPAPRHLLLQLPQSFQHKQVGPYFIVKNISFQSQKQLIFSKVIVEILLVHFFRRHFPKLQLNMSRRRPCDHRECSISSKRLCQIPNSKEEEEEDDEDLEGEDESEGGILDDVMWRLLKNVV